MGTGVAPGGLEASPWAVGGTRSKKRAQRASSSRATGRTWIEPERRPARRPGSGSARAGPLRPRPAAPGRLRAHSHASRGPPRSRRKPPSRISRARHLRLTRTTPESRLLSLVDPTCPRPTKLGDDRPSRQRQIHPAEGLGPGSSSVRGKGPSGGGGRSALRKNRWRAGPQNLARSSLRGPRLAPPRTIIMDRPPTGGPGRDRESPGGASAKASPRAPPFSKGGGPVPSTPRFGLRWWSRGPWKVHMSPRGP